MGYFDFAQICLNGHVVNDSAGTYPQYNENFCTECGAETITKCPSCNTHIRGDYHSDAVVIIGGSRYKLPKFCHNCGQPYPWTKMKIEAAQELASEINELTDDERELLAKSIDEIIKDTPKTTVAATRFKKLLAKVGAPIAESFREVLVDIISETAKKSIWG
ncbi:DUF2321 domain-containing protein [Tuberibacillus calidus]|uniref:DUF2321 domain-containing protein n=1 Tax=Tuberibacillus calidus TaxID=340097 RepID=UPI000484486B|nr:DUF2321 domain-containing protein [Tuberibacillus calidus]